MWSLSLLAKATRTRPSKIVGVDDEWAAYQFDQAVMFVGRYIYGKLNELDDKGKPLYEIDDLLDDKTVGASIDELAHIQGIVVEKR
jgi:hypothetical protein